MFSKSDFFFILKLLSEIGFFKCVDESVKLWSKYGANTTYYYQYAYRHRLDYADITQFPIQIDFGKYRLDYSKQIFLAFVNGHLMKTNHQTQKTI